MPPARRQNARELHRKVMLVVFVDAVRSELVHSTVEAVFESVVLDEFGDVL